MLRDQSLLLEKGLRCILLKSLNALSTYRKSPPSILHWYFAREKYMNLPIVASWWFMV